MPSTGHSLWRVPHRAARLVHQPMLPLGHGPVHWDTLPPEVRARALALWLQLLAEHCAHVETPAMAAGTGPASGGTVR